MLAGVYDISLKGFRENHKPWENYTIWCWQLVYDRFEIFVIFVILEVKFHLLIVGGAGAPTFNGKTSQ